MLSDREWTVLTALWDSGGAALGSLTQNKRRILIFLLLIDDQLHHGTAARHHDGFDTQRAFKPVHNLRSFRRIKSYGCKTAGVLIQQRCSGLLAISTTAPSSSLIVSNTKGVFSRCGPKASSVSPISK